MIALDLPDEAATAALAARLAAVAALGDVIALSGALGAGKTAFARAFIRARGGTGAVPSPTFTLVQLYDLPSGPVWHFDFYRLKRSQDVWELGVEDAFAEGISLIEWPELAEQLLPPDRLDLTLLPGPTADARRAELSGGGSWPGRLAALAAEGSTP